MAFYLSMDGVDDNVYYNTTPLTFDEIIIDCEVGSGRAAFDKYIGTSPGFLQRNGSSQDQWNGNWSTVYVDGVSKTNNTNFIPVNQRITIRAVGTATSNNYFVIFANLSSGSGAMPGKLYSVIVKNNGVTVAQYDMTLGNVQDQSGNGRHATLTGGTWIDESGTPTGTPGSVSYATKQSIYQNASAAYATKQSIYQTGSIPYATQQNITDGGIPGSVRYATKQVIRLTSSVPFATKQAIWRAGSSQWATMQSIMDFVQIVSTVDIRGEYDLRVDIAGEIDSIIDITGEMEPTTVDINGVIGLAIENADITIYARNDKDIRDTVKNKDGSATNLSGATVEWTLMRGPQEKAGLITKKSPTGITVTDSANGVFVVSLTDTDTDLPPKRYYYAAKVTDAMGKTTTASIGHIVIKP